MLAIHEMQYRIQARNPSIGNKSIAILSECRMQITRLRNKIAIVEVVVAQRA